MQLAEIVTRLRDTGAELEDVEVKLGKGGLPDSLTATLCAFANSRGGLVIIGLDEAAGFAATGVPRAPAMRDALVGLAREKITPSLLPSVEVAAFEGVNLVIAEVPPLPEDQRPCYVTSRGLYNGAYTRIGDGDHRLTSYEVDRMRENAGQPRWDDTPVGQATVDDLERASALRLIEIARARTPRAFSGIDEMQALTRLGVVKQEGDRLVPSLAGLLSVGTYPQQFFPQLALTVAVYPHAKPGQPGPGGERFLDSAALGGPIPELVEGALRVVQRNLRTVSRIIGAGRHEQWDLEPEVVREAIVNALMHRDYSPQSRGTQVQIELYPDRLTVTSPGGLFGNVHLETLGRVGTSSSRNSRLAALLQDAADPLTGRPVAENRGSGVSMMIDQVRRSTGAVPVFAAGLAEFRVTIPRTSPLTPQVRDWIAKLRPGAGLADAQRMAIAMAASGYDIDVAVLTRLGLDPSGARRQLRELAGLGLLRPRSTREEGPYRLAVAPPEAGSALEGFLSAPVAPSVPRLGAEILRVLAPGDEMSREEIQIATGAGRSSVVNALAELLDSGAISATAPARSPNRRYRIR
ncbi:MAG TPA: ATP-binding protein [Streptosporangiaceae bacterium]